MFRRVLRPLGSIARFLRDAASCLRGAVLASACARLATMTIRLWPRVAPLAIALGIMLGLALWGAAATGRNVFLLLAPASPTGIGAGLAAVVAALAIAELSALAILSVIGGLLQLAGDTGRHRADALLMLASAAALLVALAPYLRRESHPDLGSGMALLVGTGLVVLTLWFRRTYRLAGHRRFRDFHLDVTEARHYLARSAHGE